MGDTLRQGSRWGNVAILGAVLLSAYALWVHGVQWSSWLGAIIASAHVAIALLALRALKQAASQNASSLGDVRTQCAFDASPVGMMMVSEDGRIVLVNRALEETFGYRNEELIGQSVDMLVPQSVRPSHHAKVRSFFADPAPRRMGAGRDLCGIRKDGSAVPVEIGLNPIKTSEGNFVIGSITDVSDRQAIVREMEKVNTAIRQGAWVVAITDADGAIQYVNPQFEHTTQYRLDEVQGLTPRVLKSGVIDEQVYQDLWRTIKSGEPWRGELCNKRKDGTHYWVDSTIAPVKNAQGEITHFVAIEVEITQIKEQHDSLARMSSELEHFSFAAAHDLQEALRKVKVFTALLQDDYSDGLPDGASQHVSRIGDAAQRLGVLLQAMAQYTSTHRATVRRDAVDLNHVVQRALTVLGPQVDQVQASITTATTLPIVTGDADQLELLLYHVLSNAISFVPADRRPEVVIDCVEADPGYVGIVCRDNGVGVDPNYAERIFQPFKRLQGKHENPRAGIGLALCQKIAERHGGSIGLDSDGRNGASFLIMLQCGA